MESGSNIQVIKDKDRKPCLIFSLSPSFITIRGGGEGIKSSIVL